MTEKFTEDEYQKIVEFADKYFDEHKGLTIPANLESIYKDIFCSGIIEREKFRKLTQKFVLIALPESREWAHEQFVEKEKKYYWRYKKKDEDEDCDSWYLKKSPGIIYLTWLGYKKSTFTEREVIEAGYNPDMFDREEVG